ncbi:MAG: hypothetical protein PHE48_02510 [Candidatus Daviesbacteria bacterium]|nr:hypothetical protein [Candidatus Daviesbacteria bacterium]
MIEVLPIRLLTDEDAPIFGSLNLNLAKLFRSGVPVGSGLVVTPPQFKLKTVLENYDFGTKEVFQQSLTLVKREIRSIPVPDVLINGVNPTHRNFLLNGEKISSIKNLWLKLLSIWIEQIENKLWNNGFYPGITRDLDPQIVIFVKKMESSGNAYYDQLQDDVEVQVKTGKLYPNDLKKIIEIVQIADKKLFIPHEYEWVLDGGVKLVGLKQYTPSVTIEPTPIVAGSRGTPCEARNAVKVFLDLSAGLTFEKEVDGIYIASEKIFDLDNPSESFENLVSRLVEGAMTFPNSPIFLKLADKSEGMGKVRGTLRLLHQKSLFDPLAKVLDFARHKKGLTNVHIVVPFVRGVTELLKMKRELAVRKLSRKNSLQLWMEVAVPENIVNLEDYLVAGIDGVVLNLDELVSYLNGVDCSEEDLVFYKSEVSGLLKFLEDGIKLLHKSKVPFMVYGSLVLTPKVLEFLVEKGVYGVVVEKYEAHSAKDLLHQAEKRMILKRVDRI